MSQEIMNLSNIIHGLADMYYETTDEVEKEKISQHMDQLSKKMEEIARKRFDENSPVYRETIEKMKQMESEVVDFMENQAKHVELFQYLADFIFQLDKLLRSGKAIQGDRDEIRARIQ